MATAAALAMAARAGDGSWQSSLDKSETPEEQVSEAELFDLMRRSVNELDFVEAAVIRAYYFEGKSFTDLAATLNVSKSWVCRLHAQAMDRLTKLLKASV
jgi:RNA polymerase sigma factor for flagellar operon FliA